MNHEGRKASSKKESRKDTRSKSEDKSVPSSETAVPQPILLDPPQIVEAIHHHFGAEPAKGDQLWSDMRGNDNLLGAWDTCVQADRAQDFWGSEGPHDARIGFADWRALWAMRQDPRHLMAVCRKPSALNIVCELFDAKGSLPSNRGILFAHLVNELLSREVALCRAKGVPCLNADVIKHALVGLAYEMMARLVIPYKEARVLLSPYTNTPEQVIKGAISAGLLQVEETVRFTDPVIQEYFASEKLGEIMDSGHPAAGFWPLSRWQQSQLWAEAAVMLAGNHDPIRVAAWIADTNPLVAERCLTDSGHDLSLRDIDVAVLDLNDIAYRWFKMISEGGGFGWAVGPGLAALIARTADSERPASMKRLSDVLKQFMPEIFHPIAHDWLRIISVEDALGFFESLRYSKDYSKVTLRQYAEKLTDLRPGYRKYPLILHIDDEVGAHTLIQIMISRGFHEQVSVISIIGGAGGLILASMLLPDLVLTDVMEPGMDGFTFAGYLKKNPVTSNVPFVFLTARADSEAIETGMELGAKMYLSKPILHQGLMAAVRSVLGIDV